MERIAVRSVGKAYRGPVTWRLLRGWLMSDPTAMAPAEWVLRDVSFSIGDGEAVGIIGLNGAGKSTLLRILAGTVQPSAGSFTVNGRVAALLELGLGMHADFSGSHNAVLASQLMGLDQQQIEESLPWIRAFSELGDYMDRPVRTYSTGMQLRLAFSVATAVRPDVLIIDEALAVGDTYFQHKSMSRIRGFRDQGTTLLLVTHDPGALKALCDRALLLDRGRLVRDGEPEAVFNYYNAIIAQKERDAAIVQIENERARQMTRSGSRQAEIVAVEIIGADGSPRRVFHVGERATVQYWIRVNQEMPMPTVGFIIRDRLGGDVFGTNTYHLGQPTRDCAAGERLAAAFTVDLHLGYGNYSMSVTLHRGRDHLDGNYDWWDHALAFEVIPNGNFVFVGVAALPTGATVVADDGTSPPAARLAARRE